MSVIAALTPCRGISQSVRLLTACGNGGWPGQGYLTRKNSSLANFGLGLTPSNGVTLGQNIFACQSCLVRRSVTRGFYTSSNICAAKTKCVAEENGSNDTCKNSTNSDSSDAPINASISVPATTSNQTDVTTNPRKIPIDFITMFDRTSRFTHAIKVEKDSKHVVMFHPNPNHRIRHVNLEDIEVALGREGEARGDAWSRSRPARGDEWRVVHEQLSPSELLRIYKRLAKFRLTGLVVLTTMAGYVIAPGAFDPTMFAACCIGTGLTSSCANTVNQFLEVPYDAQMSRTRDRPLVTGLVTPLHAMGFASACGLSGLTLLYLCNNPLVAALGAFNLGLYTLAYTPLKRHSIVNTWVGSVVGAIPPMMGWAASTGALDPGAWLLGAILFAWQFPHFNSLSWNLRPDYSRAGYRMMSVTDPLLCRRVALRYSVGLIPLCSIAAPMLDVTTWFFAFTSLPPNVYQALLAWRFYKEGDSNSSRKLFRMTLLHIPVVMLLMAMDKKGFAPDIFGCDTCKSLAVLGHACTCEEQTEGNAKKT